MDHSSVPYVIRGHTLAKWPCIKWSARDWASQCQDSRFRFRIHTRNSDAATGIDWENEAIDYIEATVSHLVDYIEPQQQQCATTDSSPPSVFAKYPLDEYCLYSGYNYMDRIFKPGQALYDSINWKALDLGESKLANCAVNSTIWIGTTGSYTPCHMDTYGYNFVAQVYGRKRWILFPPSNTNLLYPTRIPYEESSIFSQVNVNRPNVDLYPQFRNCQPFIVELDPADLLYVPHHWWHFVENLGSTTDQLSISVNTWIEGQDHDSSIGECLVHLLARPLFDAYGDHTWLNLNADLFDSEESLRTLLLLMDNAAKVESAQESCPPAKVEYLKAGTIVDLVALKSCCENQTNQKTITAKDIVNCILHPDVIALIKTKLQSINKN